MAEMSLLTLLSWRTHLAVAALVRAAIVAYGVWMDNDGSKLKFTDVDYRVFTDAARHVWNGESPYLRHTYRYTPLLAAALVPNVSLHPLFGKVLFCICDLLAACLIRVIVKDLFRHLPVEESERRARLCAFLWLFNPLVLTVSARGNAESIMAVATLLVIHLFRERVFVLAGLVYGLAIHLKVYPIIYSISFYMALSADNSWRSLFHINAARVRFAVSTVFSLSLLTLICYLKYGDEFLQEAYLYHLTRKDIRHNFSVYFYMLYLTVEDDDIGLSLVAFLPQVILLLASATKFGNFHDLPFCLFCQTVIFVTFNKVCTSQYFLWYLSLLPLIIYQLNLTRKEAVCCVIIFLAVQASWLVPAYYLEFQGINTFQVIWIEGLALFTGNIGLLSKFIRKYREFRRERNLKCDINKVD